MKNKKLLSKSLIAAGFLTLATGGAGLVGSISGPINMELKNKADHPVQVQQDRNIHYLDSLVYSSQNIGGCYSNPNIRKKIDPAILRSVNQAVQLYSNHIKRINAEIAETPQEMEDFKNIDQRSLNYFIKGMSGSIVCLFGGLVMLYNGLKKY